MLYYRDVRQLQSQAQSIENTEELYRQQIKEMQLVVRIMIALSKWFDWVYLDIYSLTCTAHVLI